jgi:hypothetical protein
VKWYVYELCFPKSEKPFYIGKGCGVRMYAHLKSCAAPHVKSVVDSIKATGEKPIVREIAYFYEEADAYNFESALIRQTDGLVNIARNRTKRVVYTLFGVVFGALRGEISRNTADRMLPLFKDKVNKRVQNPDLLEMYNKLIDIGFSAAARLK